MAQGRHGARGLSLIDLLVAVVIIASLIALLMPTLGSARMQARALACGARLQQLGVAVSMYLDDSAQALPQMRGPMPGGGEGIVGSLFGGKRGELPMWGIDRFGAAERPLNPYVRSGQTIDNGPKARPVEMPEFRSPVDRGAAELYLPLPEYSSPASIYDLMGSSYVLNCHGLDGEYQATLIPNGGGRMPLVQDPTRTWLIGSHPIYCFQQDSDRGQRWYAPERTEANLVFVDLHARIRVPIPNEWCVVENTTPDYTFFPVPEPRR